MKSARLVLTAGVCAGTLAAGMVAGAVPATAQPESPFDTRARSDIASVLDRLPVVPQIDNGYTFAGFAVPAVKGKDARGCDKRERVLIASASSKPRVGAGCRLIGGSWLVDGGKRTVRAPLASTSYLWCPQRRRGTRAPTAGATPSAAPS